GSSLEFLKVGRKLELEDLEHGARRGAEIDGISVIVDPSTQVPQLIVALKFEGQESTPEPSVADVKGGSSRAEGLRIPAEAVTTSSRAKAPAGQESASKLRIKDEPASAESAKSATSKSLEADRDAADDSDDDQPEMRGKVAVLASQAEQKAKAAGEVLARLSHGAAEGAAGWFKGAQERVLKLRSAKAPERRTTAPPKSMRASEKPKLRQQSGSKDDADVDAAPVANKSRRTLAVAACVGVVGITALVFATRGSTPNAPRASDPVAAANGLNADGAPANGSAVALAPGAPRPLRDPGPPAVVTANVPLFGPTPLATTEPAPLGPVPGSDAAFIEDAEKAAAKASLRGGSNLDESFESADETSERAIERNPSKDGKLARDAATKKPEDVSPWGHGKMHEPIVHRLRLDGPGAAINGAVEPTGFTVTIPDRKVMEPTTSITKREPRLARLRAANTGSGAQISFRFKDGVPSYRVRLRRDYVEFLISSPEEKSTKGEGEGSRKKSDKR
ncbi:MAG TPA: hypothetical protein VFQ61_03895, partial [Polyangiaceae bacterium]|nr:hypothetical protein [Polyangiaceae bacterium]